MEKQNLPLATSFGKQHRRHIGGLRFEWNQLWRARCGVLCYPEGETIIDELKDNLVINLTSKSAKVPRGKMYGFSVTGLNTVSIEIRHSGFMLRLLTPTLASFTSYICRKNNKHKRN
jgi:hypothetical protein